MNNSGFLKAVSRSFEGFLGSGSRSNKKLKILHGAIAGDLQRRIGRKFSVVAFGIGAGTEMKICGRYIEKKVDIAVCRGTKPVAGIGVKFVMQNYSQNSNNYFENMLGETANIRSAGIPYFQIFIIPDKLPYYSNRGEFKKWETFTEHNSQKYKVLSEDDPESLLHTPTKTLLAVVHLPNLKKDPETRDKYVSAYKRYASLPVVFPKNAYGKFSSSVVFNDYETFAKKFVSYINFL